MSEFCTINVTEPRERKTAPVESPRFSVLFFVEVMAYPHLCDRDWHRDGELARHNRVFLKHAISCQILAGIISWKILFSYDSIVTIRKCCFSSIPRAFQVWRRQCFSMRLSVCLSTWGCLPSSEQEGWYLHDPGQGGIYLPTDKGYLSSSWEGIP